MLWWSGLASCSWRGETEGSSAKASVGIVRHGRRQEFASIAWAHALSLGHRLALLAYWQSIPQSLLAGAITIPSLPGATRQRRRPTRRRMCGRSRDHDRDGGDNDSRQGTFCRHLGGELWSARLGSFCRAIWEGFGRGFNVRAEAAMGHTPRQGKAWRRWTWRWRWRKPSRTWRRVGGTESFFWIKSNLGSMSLIQWKSRLYIRSRLPRKLSHSFLRGVRQARRRGGRPHWLVANDVSTEHRPKHPRETGDRAEK